MKYDIQPTALEVRRAALATQGLSNKAIAEVETVSVETVKSTFMRLRQKTSTKNMLTLVVELNRRKLLVWDRDRKKLVVGSIFGDQS